MNREAYNACMKPHITGSKPAEERKLDFCIGAKVCSKGMSKEEAREVCLLPKEPKAPKTKRSAGKKVNCEQNMEQVSQCLVGKISPSSSAEEIYNILVRCHCKKKNPEKAYASDLGKEPTNETLALIAKIQNEYGTA